MDDIAKSDRRIEVVKEGTVVLVEGTRKEGRIRQFTVQADEPPHGGGSDTAPSSTEYLTLSLGF